MGSRHRQIAPVAKEGPNVFEPVLDHGWPLEREAPSDDGDFGIETHRAEHLGAEHARIATLDPSFESRVVARELHGGFGVRVVCGLELHILELGTKATKEVVDRAHQIGERESFANHEPLDLPAAKAARWVVLGQYLSGEARESRRIASDVSLAHLMKFG